MTSQIQEQSVKDSRTRARGILVALLALLVAFAFVWYVFVPRSGLATVEADQTEATSVSAMNPFYVLLIGSDSIKGTALFTGMPNTVSQVADRADIITLVRIDPAQRAITLLSIPRDTYCADSEERLCDVFIAETPELLVAEVEELAGVEIGYYVVVTFAEFENIIDEIGGIQVDVANELSILDPTTGKIIGVPAGPNQTLYGAQALAFVSSINEDDPNGDALRQNNVRAAEQAMLARVTADGEDSARRAITALRENVTTNIDPMLLVSLAVDYALHNKEYTFLSGTAPYTLVEQEDGRWAVPADMDQWRALMSLVDSGQDPTYVVGLPEPMPVEEESANKAEETDSTKEDSKEKGKKAKSKKSKGKEGASSDESKSLEVGTAVDETGVDKKSSS